MPQTQMHSIVSLKGTSYMQQHFTVTTLSPRSETHTRSVYQTIPFKVQHRGELTDTVSEWTGGTRGGLEPGAGGQAAQGAPGYQPRSVFRHQWLSVFCSAVYCFLCSVGSTSHAHRPVEGKGKRTVGEILELPP